LAAVENFCTEIVQHLKSWTPAPPRVRDDDTDSLDENDSPVVITQAQHGEIAQAVEYVASPETVWSAAYAARQVRLNSVP
jgi:hypothetical protein